MMRYSGRGQQTGGRRARAWARRSVAGNGLPVSPERGERRESSSALPAALVCSGPDGGAASRGLSRFFGRLRLPTMRRAGAAARFGRGAAAALLAAAAALLALPLQAQAQTVVTLVNSSSQTEGQSSTALGNNWEIAQGFTTGSNADGYTLTDIRAEIPTVGSSPSLTVTLHKHAPTNAAIATLTNPATLPAGHLTFTAPASTTLDVSTTYYVLFNGENIFLGSTTSDNEDTTGLSDWSIENVRYRRDDRTTDPFTEVAASTPIRVRGTVVPPDIITPTLSSAEVRPNGKKLLLTFSEDLDIATPALPAAVVGAFFVTAGGLDVEISAVTAQSTATDLLVALRSPARIAKGQTVTLSYDKSEAGTDALEDAAENEVASFTDFAVTNNSTVVEDDAIEIADASAAENAGHLLFEVTLARAVRNTVKVDFETISGGTATEGEDYHARRTYTHVILAGDRTAQMGFALIEDTVAAAGETVKVRLSNARVVDAYGDKIKDIDITRDEATGTITAPATTTTNVPGLTIRIRDATGDEDDGWLDFRVRLSRKYTDYVCYDFETISGGTATEGTDYLKFPKATYWMQIGKRVDKPFVRIIDDSVNDNGETVKVKISNAHVCGDPSQTVSITRAEATGTITNSDPIPQAWLARFGRTVADQVLDAVEARLRAARTAGMSVSLAGERIGVAAAKAAAKADEKSGAASDGKSTSLFGATAPDAGDTARLKALSDWLSQETEEKDRSNGWSRTMTERDLLLGSSFSLAAQPDGGGFAALWGRMAQTSFAGREDTLSLDGDVTTGLLGADYASGRWTTGLVVSHSIGEGGYRGENSGEIEASVTVLTPWAGYAVTERLSVWGAAGYGAGELKLTAGDDPALKTDLGMMLAAAGARGTLIGGDGPKLEAVTDARWVRTTTASVSSSASDGGKLASASAEVTRLRLGLEGSWPFPLGDGALGKGATVTPRLALGVRHDGGDAETGFGADIGGGVTLAAPAQGLTVSLEGRGVLTHEAAGLRDRGIAGSLAWDPPPSNGRGPKLTLTQSIGAGASGGKDALLSRTTLEGLAANDNGDGRRRLEARFGYGFSAFGGGFTMSPEIGLGLSEAGRDYSLGWRLRRDGSGPGSLELSLEARRRESANEDTPPEHGIGFRLTARF